MRRVDFRLEDEWWELAEVLAKELECSIHQLGWTALTNEIRILAGSDSEIGLKLQAAMERQRQRDRQRQRENLLNED